MTGLDSIQKLLDESGFISTVADDQETALPYNRILVATEKGLLEISIAPQIMGPDGDHSACYSLQFQYVLPIDLSPSLFQEISNTLHFFNRLLHCPGFELDELSNQIIYRYVWLISPKGLEAPLLKQVIGNVSLCFQLFAPYIEEIAQGKYRLEDILAEVIPAHPS